jgi:alpha-amylase/alpha-mannosidase (GH57 family)
MTRVALLWHMHQPFYQDLLTGEHVLPWVRLHALKDYWGMVAILREFPQMRCTFNLVPSLLVQLQAFARGEARDRHLELGLKPAESLTDEERIFCVEHFFYAHRERMIGPHGRYGELHSWRGDDNGNALDARARAAQFSADDIRDLQVWHKLVWIDPIYHDTDVRVRALLQKGRNFTEDDKQTLRQVELELLSRVIPEYREAAARGQVELSTSPFYHPILPLLCDTDVYLRTHPDSRMPRERFSRPEDALEQLRRAVRLHTELFGGPPRGVWPSEGSISDDMVPLVARAGFDWMATDEEVLARTLGRGLPRDGSGHAEFPEVLYRPYRVGAAGHDVACGFRDHTLSDLIGFTYSGWSAESAAADFVQRLVEGGRRFTARAGGADATIFVVLDGENAWEHYHEQGRPFLRALYGRLSAHPELHTVTMSEACGGASERLPGVFPGSWINGDFYIWIGHADDRLAWGQLSEARRTYDAVRTTVAAGSAARAYEELLIAEGSDWFWWYGDDHSSDHDRVFDELFRRHVQNVYRSLERPVPDELFVSNITTRPSDVAIHRPTGFISPVIDGEATSYFEWLGAGCAEIVPTGGVMHQVAGPPPAISVIEFGFDLEALYVRVSGPSPMRELLQGRRSVTVNFLEPSGMRVEVSRPSGALTLRVSRRTSTGSQGAETVCPGATGAAGRLVELRLPFRCLGVSFGQTVSFIVALNDGSVEVEHRPHLRPIVFQVPGPDFPAYSWTA